MPQKTISIIINNYNYGRFLRQCIDSVLDQTASAGEIIVVDDGSKDESREILKEYDDRVRVILKTNGGQASALNAGFERATGNWILFLDADDYLLPHALQVLRPNLEVTFNRIVFPLRIAVNEKASSRTIPHAPTTLPEGRVDLSSLEKEYLNFPPTTGNLFARSFLQQNMPIPEQAYRISADLYLSLSDLQNQRILAIREPLAVYRTHATNAYHTHSQFYLSASISQRRVEAIKSLCQLLVSQNALPNASAVSDEAMQLLSIGQLKDLILANRISQTTRQMIPWSMQQIKKSASSAIRNEIATSSRIKETINLFVLERMPLRLIPLLGWIEARWKAYRGHVPT